jgi:hypothetical protein
MDTNVRAPGIWRKAEADNRPACNTGRKANAGAVDDEIECDGEELAFDDWMKRRSAGFEGA